ncbi:MAG: sigma-70 family RNA polymerase sigma factor [Planctomycetota bacterium]
MDDHPPLQLETLLAESAWVRRLAQSLVLGRGEADDVVQQAWLNALRRPPRQGSARAWLGTVVRNIVWRRRIAEDRRTRFEQAAAAEEPQPSAEAITQKIELQRRVNEAVVALEEPYRTAIALRFYDDMPPREIAARLRLPVETVRTRLKRALAQLRQRLDRDYGGERTSWGMIFLGWIGKGAWVEAGAAAGSTTVASIGAGKLLAGGLAMGTGLKVASAVVVVAAAGAAVWQLVGKNGSAPCAANPVTAAASEAQRPESKETQEERGSEMTGAAPSAAPQREPISKGGMSAGSPAPSRFVLPAGAERAAFGRMMQELTRFQGPAPGVDELLGLVDDLAGACQELPADSRFAENCEWWDIPTEDGLLLMSFGRTRDERGEVVMCHLRPSPGTPTPFPHSSDWARIEVELTSSSEVAGTVMSCLDPTRDDAWDQLKQAGGSHIMGHRFWVTKEGQAIVTECRARVFDLGYETPAVSLNYPDRRWADALQGRHSLPMVHYKERQPTREMGQAVPSTWSCERSAGLFARTRSLIRVAASR